MNTCIVVPIAFLTTMCIAVHGDFTLGSTSWGELGVMKECTDGAYVNGFRLKVEQPQGLLMDDSALNSIHFSCSDAGVLVTSDGNRGVWENWHYCPSGEYLQGVFLRSQYSMGFLDDDVAATSLSANCTGGSLLIGEGPGWGSWEHGSCMTGMAVCGLQTQVELAATYVVDKTGLNKITVKCCPMVNDK